MAGELRQPGLDFSAQAHHRLADWPTAVQAAREAMKGGPMACHRVLAYLLSEGPRTDEEGADDTSMGETYRKRRADLKNAQLVRPATDPETGKVLKRPSRQGQPMICWEIVDDAMARSVLERLLREAAGRVNRAGKRRTP